MISLATCVLIASLVLPSHCDGSHYSSVSHDDITCDMLEKKGTFGDHLKCIENQVYIRRAYWIGNHDKEQEELVVSFCKFCKSFYTNESGRFVQLNPSQCLSNRQGQLCSCCSNTTSPAINSRHFECILCRDENIIIYFLYNIIGLGLLCLFIFIWNFFPASGSLNALIFFGQISTTAIRLDCMGTIPLSTVFDSPVDNRTQLALEFLYGVWNLDFTYPASIFCFSQKFDTVKVLTLNYFVASLPLVVVVVMVLLVRFLSKILNSCGRTFSGVFGETCYYYSTFSCLRTFPWLTRSVRFEKWRSIKTLVASCFLLSYTKFTMTTFYLLAPVNLINSSGKTAGTVLYYHGSLKYFGPNHTRYGILAIFFLVTFVIGFPLCLFLLRYKPFKDLTYQRHRSCWKETMRYLDQFLDACILRPFQRDLKWGKKRSEPCVGFRFWKFSFGIHDYRWYAGWYFLLRFSFFAANLFSMDFVEQLLLNEILSMIALIISLIAQPYKRRVHNQVDAFILILISVLNVSVFFQYYLTYTDQKLSSRTFIVQYILIFIPAAMIVIQFIAKLVVNYRHELSYEIDDEISVNFTETPTVTSTLRREDIVVSSNTPSHTSTIQVIQDTKLQRFVHQYLCSCNRISAEQENRQVHDHATINTPLLKSGSVN